MQKIFQERVLSRRRAEYDRLMEEKEERTNQIIQSRKQEREAKRKMIYFLRSEEERQKRLREEEEARKLEGTFCLISRSSFFSPFLVEKLIQMSSRMLLLMFWEHVLVVPVVENPLKLNLPFGLWSCLVYFHETCFICELISFTRMPIIRFVRNIDLTIINLAYPFYPMNLFLTMVILKYVVTNLIYSGPTWS